MSSSETPIVIDAFDVVPQAALPLEAYLPSYLTSLQARGHRPRGITKYGETIRHFFGWIRNYVDEPTMETITMPAIERYQEERAASCSGGTVGNALTVIRSFCRWAQRRGLRLDDPTIDLEWPKRRIPAPRALKYAQLHALMLAINTTPARLPAGARWRWHRNRRAIYLMLFAGLRIAEASALCWRDVDLETMELWVRDGKGGKDRCIPLHQALLFELDQVPLPDRQGDHAVAGNTDGAQLGPKSMAHIFERWLPALGITISAHMLRHSFATEMLRGSADILSIQVLLGHVSLETTQKYLVADTSRTKAAVDKLPSSW